LAICGYSSQRRRAHLVLSIRVESARIVVVERLSSLGSVGVGQPLDVARQVSEYEQQGWDVGVFECRSQGFVIADRFMPMSRLVGIRHIGIHPYPHQPRVMPAAAVAPHLDVVTIFDLLRLNIRGDGIPRNAF
jgi:hypothetical protein